MAKNTRWSPEDLRKKGLVQNEKGDYVKVESLVAKGKVEKIEPGKSLVERMAESQESIDLSNRKIRSAVNALPILQVAMENINLSPEEMIKAFEERGYLLFEPDSDFTLPDGEQITTRHRFDLAPCPAPRMTSSDRWKTDPYHPDPKFRQRKKVTRYFKWRDAFRAISADKGFVLGETLRVVFIVAVPDYLSKAKKAARIGQYHKQRPDVDNFCKSVMDCFRVDDGYVADLRAVKMWGEKAEIIIF